MKIIITESQFAELSEKLEVELQRGYGAWFDFTTEEIIQTPKKKIPMQYLHPNQPVKDEQYQDYQDIVDQIIADYKKKGTLMPLLVFRDGKKYTIIDGHHRWTAAKQLGKKTMVCHIIPKENIKLVHKWDKNGKEIS